MGKSRIRGLGRQLNRLRRGSGERRARLDIIVFFLNRRVLACPPFNLSETCKVPSFEIAITVLKLPQRRIRVPCVEYVALYIDVSKYS